MHFFFSVDIFCFDSLTSVFNIMFSLDLFPYKKLKIETPFVRVFAGYSISEESGGPSGPKLLFSINPDSLKVGYYSIIVSSVFVFSL